MMINEQINNLQKEIESYQLDTLEKLETFKKKFISKKGILSSLFSQLRKLPLEEKKAMGKLVNDLKHTSQQKYAQAQKKLHRPSPHTNSTLQEDITLPPPRNPIGTLHPLTHTTQKIIQIFKRIGFSIAQGPEVESEWNNFTALNFLPDHPARQMQDTFFIAKPTKHKDLLRTHTSSVQIRTIQNTPPPIRILSTGKVFRKETISSRTHCIFHQIEGLYINKNVNFLELKATTLAFIHQFFDPKTKTRFRPSYFPFTEPSAEIDINCILCQSHGCSVCKYTGWIEIAGAGMIDPAVLTNCGIDANTYSGFAFGLGVERLAMLRYKIPDIRLFTQNDVRFLRQFAKSL